MPRCGTGYRENGQTFRYGAATIQGVARVRGAKDWVIGADNRQLRYLSSDWFLEDRAESERLSGSVV